MDLKFTKDERPTMENFNKRFGAILTDETKALYGLDSNAVPDDVLNVLNTLVGTAQSTANTAQSTANTAQSAANARAQIATGSYKGTGTYGESNPNSLTFDFEPKLLILIDYDGVAFIRPTNTGAFNTGLDSFAASPGHSIYANGNYSSIGMVVNRIDGTTVYWFAGNLTAQKNDGRTHQYIAIG